MVDSRGRKVVYGRLDVVKLYKDNMGSVQLQTSSRLNLYVCMHLDTYAHTHWTY